MHAVGLARQPVVADPKPLAGPKRFAGPRPDVAALQRAAGNAAVARLLAGRSSAARPPVQREVHGPAANPLPGRIEVAPDGGADRLLLRSAGVVIAQLEVAGKVGPLKRVLVQCSVTQPYVVQIGYPPGLRVTFSPKAAAISQLRAHGIEIDLRQPVQFARPVHADELEIRKGDERQVWPPTRDRKLNVYERKERERLSKRHDTLLASYRLLVEEVHANRMIHRSYEDERGLVHQLSELFGAADLPSWDIWTRTLVEMGRTSEHMGGIDMWLRSDRTDGGKMAEGLLRESEELLRRAERARAAAFAQLETYNADVIRGAGRIVKVLNVIKTAGRASAKLLSLAPGPPGRLGKYIDTMYDVVEYAQIPEPKTRQELIAKLDAWANMAHGAFSAGGGSGTVAGPPKPPRRGGGVTHGGTRVGPTKGGTVAGRGGAKGGATGAGKPAGPRGPNAGKGGKGARPVHGSTDTSDGKRISVRDGAIVVCQRCEHLRTSIKDELKAERVARLYRLAEQHADAGRHIEASKAATQAYELARQLHLERRDALAGMNRFAGRWGKQLGARERKALDRIRAKLGTGGMDVEDARAQYDAIRGVEVPLVRAKLQPFDPKYKVGSKTAATMNEIEKDRAALKDARAVWVQMIRDEAKARLGATLSKVDDSVLSLHTRFPKKARDVGEIQSMYMTLRDLDLTLRRHSERLAVTAALEVGAKLGTTRLTPRGDTPGKAGTLDVVFLQTGRPQRLIVLEAKGGTSPLGTRRISGADHQQGTAEYLYDLLNNDPDLHAADPTLRARIAKGDVVVDYYLVEAPGGTAVSVSKFELSFDRQKIKP